MIVAIVMLGRTAGVGDRRPIVEVAMDDRRMSPRFGIVQMLRRRHAHERERQEARGRGDLAEASTREQGSQYVASEF